MYSVQTYSYEHVSHQTRSFHSEVEQLAKMFSLRSEGGVPALELYTHPHFQAMLEYTLWGETGVVLLKGKLQFAGDQQERCEAIPVTMRFSLSVDPHMDMEGKKLRIEEFFGSDAELIWYIPPAGLDDHLELALHFLYAPGSNMLFEYGRCVLEIITGKSLAA
jgi:hypothetical protein